MVLRTVLSVIDQDYPRERVLVVVSDDAGNPELAAELDGLGVIYHRPPHRDTPGRDGAAKSGNLNSALEVRPRALPGDPLRRDPRCRRRARHEPVPPPSRGPAGVRSVAGVRADDQGGAGLGGRPVPALAILISVGYWGGMNSAALAGFVVRGWFGMSPTQALRSLDRRHHSPSVPVTDGSPHGGLADHAILVAAEQ